MRNLRTAAYYLQMIDRIGDRRSISTLAFYDLLLYLDNSFGIKSNKAGLSILVHNIMDMFDGAMVSKEDKNTKRVGRQVPMLYKIIDIERAKTCVTKHFNSIKSERTHEAVTTSINIIESNRAKQLKREQMARLVVKKNQEAAHRLLDDLKESKKQAVEATKASDAVENSKETFKRDIQEFSEKIGRTHLDIRKNTIIFACAGLIAYRKSDKYGRSGATSTVEVDWVVKRINEDYHNVLEGKALTRQELIAVINSIKEESKARGLRYNRQQDTLYLNEFKKDWALIYDEYNPSQNKTKLYARISMKPEEVSKKFEDSRLIISISENDGIYEFIVDPSVNTRRKLLGLYLTFRGTDMFFGDPSYVHELDNMLTQENNRWEQEPSVLMETKLMNELG